MAVWNDDTLALAWKCVQIQDKLTASLGLAIHRGLDREKYTIAIKLLPVIYADAKTLETRVRELIMMQPRRGKKGRPPRWFEMAENVLHFSLKTQRAIEKIQADDLPSNKFKLMRTRLNACQSACNITQLDLMSCLPKGHKAGESYIVEQVSALLDTLEMGDEIEGEAGRGWKRNR